MSEMMVYINDGACHRYVSNTVNIQKRNLMVIAKLDNGFFYPGHVIQQWGKPEEAEVNFYQWGRRRVHRNNVISIGGAVSCPPLHVWDYVLTRMRVMGPSGMYMQYMPGRVCYVPRLPPLEHRFYSVRLYNGKVLSNPGYEFKAVMTQQKFKLRCIVYWLIAILIIGYALTYQRSLMTDTAKSIRPN